MRRLAFLLPALAVAGLVGCALDVGGEVAGDEAGEAPAGRAAAPIINGQPDRAHDAVVALLGPEHSCSGTIVATRPPYLYVLTAAHCVAPVAPTDPEVVAMGRDYQSPEMTFPIESCLPHPDYDGQVFDFAMCRALGASAETPVIAVQAEADGLEVGASLRHVGYGVTEAGGANSRKYSALGRLTELDELLLWYDQPNAGPCFGDSGGPQLSTTSPERVVGVTSFGDEGCTEYGASGRASRVLDSFIAPFVAATPSGPPGCETCSWGATSGMGQCMSAVTACFESDGCSALVGCLDGCQSSDCFDACFAQHSDGSEAYAQIVGCVCSEACVEPCAAEPACQTGAGGAPGGNGGGAGEDEPKDDGFGASQDPETPSGQGGVGACALGLGPGAGGAASAAGGALMVALAVARRRVQRQAGVARRRRTSTALPG